MPTLVIYTNVAKDKIPADFLTKATDVLAKQLGKPQKVRNFNKLDLMILFLTHPPPLGSLF